MPQIHPKRGFTLIELLIVVAIIAILAAIAVPNFLEAQTRSKNSRCKADIRSIATAIEAYNVDYSKYPRDGIYYSSTWNSGGSKWPGGGTMSQTEVDTFLCLQSVTTPVAYMTAVPDNVYPNATFGGYYVGKPAEKWYVYWGAEWKQNMLDFNPNSTVYKDMGPVWSVTSTGPDRSDNFGSYLIFGEKTLNSINTWGMYGCLYDATNGTISAGDIVRVGP